MYISRLAEKQVESSLASPKVLLILGARQVGKTTLINHVIAQSRSVLVNLDIEVEKQRVIAASSLPPTEALKSFGNPDILVIDEAQRLPEVGRVVKGWFDSKIPQKIILSGSSSLNLLNQSAESLTGRNEKIYLPPLIFREIVNFQPWYSEVFTDIQLQKNFSNQIDALLFDTLVFGSYPEIVTSGEKTKLLLNLASDYLMKDIFQLGLIKSPDTLKKLLLLLAYQIGSQVSVNELSANLGVSRITVDRYLELLEETFVIFKLNSFSTNPRKEITKSQKVYFWDTGVRNALINDFSLNPQRADIGQLWENWVVAEFAKKNTLAGFKQNLYFWKSKSGTEIDLVVRENSKIEAFEIKWQKKVLRETSFEKTYQAKVRLIDRTNPLFQTD